MLARWLSAALVVVSLGVLTGYWIYRHLAHERLEASTLDDMGRRAASLTGAVAEQTRSVVFTVDLVLRHLQHQLAQHGHIGMDDMVSVLATTPPGLVRRVTQIDAGGNVVQAHPSLPGPPVPLGDRAYFRVHADDRHSGLFIGQPIQSRFSKDWLIPVSRGLRGADGRFAGVIMLTIAPEYFARIYDTLADGEQDVVALVHRDDGAFMSRNLNLNDHLGKRVRADRPFIGASAASEGVLHSVSSHEPVDRIFAWRRLEEWPLVVVIGLGVKERLEPIAASREAGVWAAAAISLLVLALAGGVSLVLRRLARSVIRAGEAEQRLALAYSGAEALAWEWNVSGRSVTFVGDCRRLFGRTRRELRLAMEDWIEHIHPDDREAMRRTTLDALHHRSNGIDGDYRLRLADGSTRWMLVRGRTVLRRANGSIERMIGILLDIDADKRARLLAARTRETYARLTEHAAEGIFVVDREGRIELFNPAAERMLGVGADEVLHTSAGHLTQPPDRRDEAPAEDQCSVGLTLADGQARRGERLTYFHRDGRPVPVELSVAPTLLDGRPDGAVVVFNEISDRLAWEAELEKLARTDALTGVANRRHFVELSERELSRCDRDGSALSLLMLDVDHFKRVNDSHGHATGDVVLRRVALACFDELRQIDVFGRLGGEEFGAALPGVGLNGALQVAERLRARVAELRIAAGGVELSCTVSVGLATRRPGESLDSLLARADDMLYSAKRSGRDRVVCDPADGRAADAGSHAAPLGIT